LNVKVSKTAIFLFELMAVILVFSIATAVCVEIFGAAHRFSAESTDLTMAVLKAESVAEEFKAGETPDGVLYFDKEWKTLAEKEAGEDKAAYFISTDLREEDGMEEMSISVQKTGYGGPQEVYGLQVKSYRGGSLAGADVEDMTGNAEEAEQ
jgi:hypothetical protein